ncbi:TonB family protein [Mucilaginibacter sp. PAMB04168]|uniref:TonB family protein n=1 Tax=Mucilaginibacter sp. PAMB04168 TaxID=3138567 RepID=UPI0031F6A667
MSDKKNDISQIQKYLNGELDARAMHELERQALDDPFLMDALEGYAQTNSNQNANLGNLASRLQLRVKPQAKRVVLWPKIAVAASVMLFISIGGWWLLNYRPAANVPAGKQADKTNVVQKQPAPLKVQAVPQEKQAVIKPAASNSLYTPPLIAVQKQKHPLVLPKVAAAPSTNAAQGYLNEVADTLQKAKELDDVVVVGYGTSRKQDLIGKSALNLRAATMDSALQGRVAGLTIASKAKLAKVKPVIMVNGQVLYKDDGQPVVGAMVKNLNSGSGTNTNVNGIFSITAADKDELRIAYIGYKAEQLKVHGNDSIKVYLSSDNRALAEVVVAGITPKQQVIKRAHPIYGWDQFKEYLENEAQSPDDKTGTVKLSFVVNPDKTLSDFKISKSVSQEADQHAIAIIKAGPAWLPNVNGKPETVKVRINFK